MWSFSNGGDDSSYFGRMPPPIVENLLWLYTEPGEIVVDLAIRRETLRSVWTVSKLRTHSAVTLTVIGRRVQVGEQIPGAKWAVKRAIQDADQHDRSEQYAQQQTPDQ